MSATATIAVAAGTAGPGGNYASAGLLLLRIVAGGLVAAHGLQKTSRLLGGSGLDGGAEEFREDGFRGGRLTAAAAGASVEGMFQEGTDLFRREEGALVLGVPRLSAAIALALAGWRR